MRLRGEKIPGPHDDRSLFGLWKICPQGLKKYIKVLNPFSEVFNGVACFEYVYLSK